jgi:hypothetical protein
MRGARAKNGGSAGRPALENTWNPRGAVCVKGGRVACGAASLDAARASRSSPACRAARESGGEARRTRRPHF